MISKTTFQHSDNLYSIIGFTLIFYAMIGYQVPGLLLGHRDPVSFPCGKFHCPTNAFTLGMFLLTVGSLPKNLLIIPITWAFSGIFPYHKAYWKI
jgi:hypothetical protein